MRHSAASWRFAALLVLACSVLATAARAYETADLAGPWRFHTIASGPGQPWWERAWGTISPSGAFAGSAVDSQGDSSGVAGSFAVSPSGIVTVGGLGTLRGALDAGRTVMVATDTWTGFGAGTTELRVGVKSVSPHLTSDLVGDWEIHSLASGPGAPWWQRGRIAVAADGAFSGSFTEIDGSTEGVAGAFTLSSDGVLSLVGSPTARGALDAAHRVMVMASTWTGFAAGTADLTVGVRVAGPYTTAELAGTWELHTLASGPGAPDWSRGSIVIGADGAFSGSILGSDGGTNLVNGTFALSASGVLTRAGYAAARGALDARRSVWVMTDTWTTGSPGTSESIVAVRTLGATLDAPGSDGPSLAIERVSPNPVRAGTPRVRFTLPRSGIARLDLLDVSGRVVASHTTGELAAGQHELPSISPDPPRPGLYWLRLSLGHESRVARVAVID